MDKFEQFWQAYPNRKGKGAAAKKYEKIDEDTHKAILLAIDAQKRHRNLAKKTGEFMPEWCMPVTWLNQQRWLDEIPSHAETKEKSEVKKCHCGNDWPCEKHYYDTIKATDWRWKALNEHWQALGKPKTQMECIEALRKKGCLNLLLLLKKPAGKRGGDLTKMGDL